jgi:hypothetical protein
MKSKTSLANLSRISLIVAMSLFMPGCNKIAFTGAGISSNAPQGGVPTPSVPGSQSSGAPQPGADPGANNGGSNSPVPPNPSGGGSGPVVGPVNPPVIVPPVVDPCSLTTTRLTKVLFLVDQSGSNYGFFGIGGTDSKKKFRQGTIQKYFDKYKDHTNVQWGFMSFAGTTAKDLVGQSGVNAFTSDITKMQSAISAFGVSDDWGDTPYKAALRVVTNAITADPDLGTSANPQYYVIMLTDGYPTDIESNQEVKAIVQNLASLGANQVSLNTVFYGAQGTEEASAAIELLTDMAAEGKGQFQNVNNPSSVINIDDLIHPNCAQ